MQFFKNSAVSRRQIIAGAVGTIPLIRRLSGQSSGASVKPVEILVTVLDKEGRVVKNLSKEDFVLQEDGQLRTIDDLAQQSVFPLFTGLLVDTSSLQRRMTPAETSDSQAFVEHLQQQKSRKAFLIHFDTDTELLQDLTSSPVEFKRALDRLSATPTPPYVTPMRVGWPQNIPFPADLITTVLNDALYLAAVDVLGQKSGTKVLVLLSTGNSRGSNTTLERAMRAAQLRGITVYSIWFSSEKRKRFPVYNGGGYPQDPIPNIDLRVGRQLLDRVSRQTGGSYFEVSKKHQLKEIYAQIQEELGSRYALRYTPPWPSDKGEFHRVKVTMRNDKLTAQTVPGYYANS